MMSHAIHHVATQPHRQQTVNRRKLHRIWWSKSSHFIAAFFLILYLNKSFICNMTPHFILYSFIIYLKFKSIRTYIHVFIRFVRDSSKFWYKPTISREEAIALLRNAPPGSFLVRDSTTYDIYIFSNIFHWKILFLYHKIDDMIPYFHPKQPYKKQVYKSIWFGIKGGPTTARHSIKGN